MILNILAVIAVVIGFLLLVGWAIKVSEYCDKELPDTVNGCLFEIQELTEHLCNKRIDDLCGRIEELYLKNYLEKLSFSEKRKNVIRLECKNIDYSEEFENYGDVDYWTEVTRNRLKKELQDKISNYIHYECEVDDINQRIIIRANIDIVEE